MKLDLSVIKNQPKISKKDLMMLGILVFVVVVYLAVSLLLVPNIKSLNDKKAASEQLSEKVEAAKKEYILKEKYEKDLKDIQTQIKIMKDSVPQYISQEDIILTIGKFSNMTGLGIVNMNFHSLVSYDIKDLQSGKITLDTIKQAFNSKNNFNYDSNNSTQMSTNQNSSSTNNNSTQTTTGKTGSTPESGVLTCSGVTLSYAGSYNSLYKFLRLIESNPTVICTLSLDVETSDVAGVYAGVINLMYVGYRDKNDKGEYMLETPEIKGKINPFSMEAGKLNTPTDNNKQNNTITPTFLITLNSYRDNAPKVIMSTYPKAETQISVDKNETMNGKLIIGGSKGSYNYTYSIGKESYKGTGELTIKDGTIVLQVLSMLRDSDSDKVALTMDIDNSSDLPVVVNVLDKNIGVKRFTLGKTTGKVTQN